MTELDRSLEAASHVGLGNVLDYLRRAGWEVLDQDESTSMWRSDLSGDEVRVVLPNRESDADYVERLLDAVRALAFVERRRLPEVLDDLVWRGVDHVAVRLSPDAPAGQAPIDMAHAALASVRSFIIASASALQVNTLVLPPRRPQRAELYTRFVKFSTDPGSFILNLALPHHDDSEVRGDGGLLQESLIDVTPEAYGRRVVSRMAAVTRRATALAREVGAGDRTIRAFAEAGIANATELDALGSLGGPEQSRYYIRFAPSPSLPSPQWVEPLVLPVTPADQRILKEAAEFLRTKQPRADVTVVGLVVRLHRDGTFGPGEIAVQGIDDDSGQPRRFYLELGEDDYEAAVNAHRQGLQVIVVGDIELRGTRMSMRRVTSFQVIPGL